MREKIKIKAKNRRKVKNFSIVDDKPSLIDVLHSEGARLERKGDGLWGSCPFHTDNSPSFKVTPEKELFYCFSCHKGGDVYTFVMEAHGLDFKGAVKYLKGESVVVYNPVKARARSERKALLEMFRAWETTRCAALGDVLRWFRQKQARDGFTNKEIYIFSPLIKRISDIEYEHEILCTKNDEMKFKFFKMEKGLAKI